MHKSANVLLLYYRVRKGLRERSDVGPKADWKYVHQKRLRRGREREQRGPKTISDLEGEDLGDTGGSTRGGMIGHVLDSTVDGREGEAGQLLSTNRRDGEQRQVDRQAISEEVAKVVTGAETDTEMATAIEEKMMT